MSRRVEDGVRVLHVSLGRLVAVLEGRGRAEVSCSDLTSSKHSYSLGVDLVLALVVPRVDHVAALGEVEVAVSVTELPGLECQLST